VMPAVITNVGTATRERTDGRLSPHTP
jgi:hypothetical protein